MPQRGQLTPDRFGFSMPVDAPLYPRPPYRYEGATLVKFAYTTDPALASRIVPEPLTLADPPTAGLVLASYPASDLGPYDEVVVYLDVLFRGVPYQYAAYLYVTTDVAMAAGREMGGYPKKIGRIDLTLGPDDYAGSLERPAGTRLLSASFTPKVQAPPTSDPIDLNYLCLRVLPSPHAGGPPSVRELAGSHWTLRPAEIWAGQGRFEMTGASQADPLQSVPLVEMGTCLLIRGDILVRQNAFAESMPLGPFPGEEA